MIVTEKKLCILRPTEGNMLTQAADVAAEERVFVEIVHLGSLDSVENWREITKEEAADFCENLRNELAARAAEEVRAARRRELEAELASLNESAE